MQVKQDRNDWDDVDPDALGRVPNHMIADAPEDDDPRASAGDLAEADPTHGQGEVPPPSGNGTTATPPSWWMDGGGE